MVVVWIVRVGIVGLVVGLVRLPIGGRCVRARVAVATIIVALLAWWLVVTVFMWGLESIHGW